MFLALMILVFIVVPFVELWLIIMLAEWLGGGWQGAALTIVLLLIDSVVGALLLRGQGMTVFANFLGAMRERRVPHREAVDGVFVAVGGALLLTPGFLTDILGFALLIPPSRRVFTAFTTRRISKRVMGAIGVEGFKWQSQGTRGAYSQSEPASAPVEEDDVVDVVAVEEEIDFRFDKKRLEGP